MTDALIDPAALSHGIGKDTIPSIEKPVFVAHDDPLLAERGADLETEVLGVFVDGIARTLFSRLLGEAQADGLSRCSVEFDATCSVTSRPRDPAAPHPSRITSAMAMKSLNCQARLASVAGWGACGSATASQSLANWRWPRCHRAMATPSMSA